MNFKIFIAYTFLFFAVTSCTNQQKDDKTVADTQQHTDVDSNAAAAMTLLPSFSIQDVSGSIINLENLKGKKSGACGTDLTDRNKRRAQAAHADHPRGG